MKVILNNSEVIIFKGATISEMVLAYSLRSYKMLKSGKLRVYDRFGNHTEIDGPVYDGQLFYLKRAE